MATSNATTKCHTCREETTTYICTGCSNHFCFDDLVEHRESLKPQFHAIEDQRNEFMQTLSDQHKNNAKDHPLTNQINQWERRSIDKVRQIANEQRQLVQQSIHENAQNIQSKLEVLTEEMQKIAKRKDFNELILSKLRTQMEDLKKQLNQSTHIEIKEDSSSAYLNKLSIVITPKTDQTNVHRHQLRSNLKWKQHAKTIAGGNGEGDKLNQLNCSEGIYVDDQQTMYIADRDNHRIVQWKLGENNGRIIAGGNGQGDRVDHLDWPTDVIVDQNNKSLIICDEGNRRVVRWSLENPQYKQIIIENIACWGLMMNENGDLFVSDYEKHEVKRWRNGENEGTIVAGGNGEGDQLNQPTFLFIDRQETVYVSDTENHRVMKWLKGAQEGIVVAGEQRRGNSLKQLSYPYGLIVNEVGDVYVADCGNDRIMCWSVGSKEGRVVVGGNGEGQGSNQFNGLRGLSFDVENNVYVADNWNHRIQRFDVEKI